MHSVFLHWLPFVVFGVHLEIIWEGGGQIICHYGRSRTKVSGVGVKSFQILKLFRGTKAL